MEADGKLTKAAQYLITFAALVIVIAGLNKTASIVVPLLLAVFIAMISAPPLFWLKKKGVPVVVAILFIIVVMILIGLLISIIIGSSLNDFSSSLPSYQSKLHFKAQLLLDWLEASGIERLDKAAILKALDPGASMKLVTSLLLAFKAALTNGFLILLTVIFILLEASSFPRKVKAISNNSIEALEAFDTLTNSIQHYMAIKTLTSLATGILIAVWMFILGVDYPLLWGFLAFLLNYIPTIGSILASIPATLIALVLLGPGFAILVLVGFLVVNMTIGSFLEPRIMGHGLGISPLVVFVSLIFWGAILGPVGMLLSVPLTVVLKLALENNKDTKWIATMLGSERAA